MASAKNEALKAPRRWGVGGGVSTSVLGEWSEDGAVPFPRNFLDF